MEPMAYAVAAGMFVLGAGVGFALRRSPAPAEPVRPVEPPPVKKPAGEPLRALALLQREGRLLDFLLEDIAAYSDAQVGAAVRDIHRGCRKAIEEHFALEPILAGDEGQPITVPVGFDPGAVRLTGNVTGEPPFRGTLQHHGWRVKEFRLPEVNPGRDEFVVAPAEVALG